MRSFARKAFHVHEGESRRVGLMSFSFFLLIAALLVVKPAVTSLFLSEFGAERLPFAYLAVALAAAVTSAAYGRLLREWPLDRMLPTWLRFSVVVLLVLWFGHFVVAFSGWVLYVAYVFVAVWAVTTASQLWILANLVFNAREAKRLFGLLGAGAIAGGIAGGYSTNLLAPTIGTENLFLVGACLLGCALPVVARVIRENPRPRDNLRLQQRLVSRPDEHAIRLIKDSPYLMLVAGLVGVAVVVARLVDYQFSASASAAIADGDELTAFFGFWLSTINILSLLVQLLLTRRVIAIAGVGWSLFLLPASILASALVFLWAPSLTGGILMRVADGSLKQSINKAGMELLYLPVPNSVKGPAKTFIDVFVDSAATGAAGVLLVAINLAGGISPREVGAAIVVLVAGWTVLSVKVRREYVRAFRVQIESLADGADGAPEPLSSQRAIPQIEAALRTGEPRLVRSLLAGIPESRVAELSSVLTELLAHEDDVVRERSLRALCFAYNVDLAARATEMMAHDRSPGVRTEAVTYLFERADDPTAFLRGLLDDERIEVRMAALACAAREARTNEGFQAAVGLNDAIVRAVRSVGDLDGAARVLVKATCAGAIGEANIVELYPYVHAFLEDGSAEVRGAALRAAGRTSHLGFIEPAVRLLERSDVGKNAIRAVALFGEAAIAPLMAAFDTPGAAAGQRLAVLGVLGRIGSQASVDELFRVLEEEDYSLRYAAVRALNRLHRDHPGLHFDEHKLERRILDEISAYLSTLTVLQSQAEAGDTDRGREALAARAQLVELLESRLDENLERIFRLLGLRYPPDAIHDAFVGIQRDQPQELRANALEFLDNLLEPGLKRTIIPLVETTLVDALVDDVLDRFELEVPPLRECVRALLAGRDVELSLAALRSIELDDPTEYLAEIAGLVASSDPRLRQAAQEVLARAGILAGQRRDRGRARD